jgi:cyclohexanone monooxygenase
VKTLAEMARDITAFQEQCTPGYYNNEGQPAKGGGLIVNVYGKGPIAFFQLTADWRAEGEFAGLEMRT